METESLKPLSDIEKKAEELSVKHGVKVIPVVFGPENDRAVGYLKEIPRLAKLRVMDKLMLEPYTACEALVESQLIKEESDPRLMTDDSMYIGVVQAIQDMVSVSVNQFKKK